jgi:hypothetical protein
MKDLTKNMVKDGKNLITVVLPMYIALGCSNVNLEPKMEGKLNAETIEICDTVIRNPGYEQPFAERPECIRDQEALYVGLLSLLNKEEFKTEVRDGEVEYVKVAYPVDALHEEAVKMSAEYRNALHKADYDPKNGVVESGAEAETLVEILSKMKPVRKKNTDGAWPLKELQFGRSARR